MTTGAATALVVVGVLLVVAVVALVAVVVRLRGRRPDAAIPTGSGPRISPDLAVESQGTAPSLRSDVGGTPPDVGGEDAAALLAAGSVQHGTAVTSSGGEIGVDASAVARAAAAVDPEEVERLQAELARARAEAEAGDAELERIRARLAEEQEHAARATAGRAEEAHRLTEEAARLSARQTRLVEREQRLSEREDRMGEREDRLTEREERVAAELTSAQQAKQELTGQRSLLEKERAALAQAETEQQRELERIAGLTADAAARELVAGIEDHAKRQAAISVRDIEAEARREADRRAREITSQAIQRVASQQTTESVVSVLHLPSEDMKGRIIGREGRNIRAFETLTGVNVLIDDTPEAVALSCFDPVRREIARVALSSLVADGRIHPQRIEDSYEQAKAEVEATIDATGHDVLLEVDITEVHPELVTLLGRLRYRTSYGQNVLRHLVETAHIASGMAAELGLGRDGISVVKRAAFFHDIGKALTHEVEGSHALVGADVARRCGESEEVVHAIAAHHLEIPPQTVEAWLTIGSDSCSGGRPGARRESLEAYVERLKRIEEIAYSRDGVERVYAMNAGRELRVMVLPDEVDDLGAQVLARDIAKQIEDQLTYPGQVRVTVVRESRATETAH